MTNRLFLLFKKMLAPWEVTPITVTSPPSSLPPVLAGIVVRNLAISSVWDASETGPTHNDPLATIFDLAIRNIIEIEETNKNIIIRQISDKIEYQFEEVLLSLIPRIGYIKLGDFFNNYNRNVIRFSSAVKDDALRCGLYHNKISSRNLTELGKRESKMWSNFRLYILAIVDDQDSASKKTQDWVTYLPYAAEFYLGKAWIKMFAKLDATAPKWFKIDQLEEQLSSNKVSLKTVE